VVADDALRGDAFNQQWLSQTRPTESDEGRARLTLLVCPRHGELEGAAQQEGGVELDAVVAGRGIGLPDAGRLRIGCYGILEVQERELGGRSIRCGQRRGRWRRWATRRQPAGAARRVAPAWAAKPGISSAPKGEGGKRGGRGVGSPGRSSYPCPWADDSVRTAEGGESLPGAARRT
jgi:hypothetical protein